MGVEREQCVGHHTVPYPNGSQEHLEITHHQVCNMNLGRKKVKGDAENPSPNTLSKNTSAFSQDTRNKHGSPCNHGFDWLLQSYGCRQTPVGIL